MTTQPDLSVVIVTYRVRDQVHQCLRSLFGDGGLRGIDAEVILVDNASGDGTVEMVRSEFPEVDLIAGTENVGFARANNAGIFRSRGRNVLLLNPDTIVPPAADGSLQECTLAACVHFLDGLPSAAGAMSCRVESLDGSLQIECARRLVTPWSECCRALLLDRLFSRFDTFNREAMVHWGRTDTRAVECFLGAFMMIRRRALESVGGLDERFFLMYEDVDWCRRALNAGLTLIFWPGARITHLGGQSWRQEPIKTFAASHESAMLYFAKHHKRAVGVVRAVHRVGMELKIALLRLNLLRRRGDPYTLRHLEMARAARLSLRSAGSPS